MGVQCACALRDSSQITRNLKAEPFKRKRQMKAVLTVQGIGI